MNQLIIITGCSGHLGSAMLNSLIKNYIVIGISRSSQSIKINPDFQSRFIPLNYDFSNQKVEDIVFKVQKLIDNRKLLLKGLVNNAIFNIPKSPLEINSEEAAQCSEGVLSFHLRLSISLKPFFSPPSSIINITSMYGKVSPDPSIYDESNPMNSLLYGSLKAAFIQSSKYLSSVFSPHNIRVNSVSYGPFPSEKVIRNNPKFINELKKRTHLNRIGKPYECAGVIKFLLSNESSFITGADIPVDGGWTAW